MLTAERLRELLSYDPFTGLFTWRVSRGGMCAGMIAGTHDKDGYTQISIDSRLYKASRLAWFYIKGEWPGFEVDHRNTTRSDNSWDNLRQATNAQNKQNIRKAHADSKSGFLGVCANRGRWQAEIQVNGKKKHIGYFDTPELAHAAYLEAKVELHPFQTIVEKT